MSSAVFKFRTNTIPILEIYKGHNFNKTVGGVADDALYLYKILQNIFNSYKAKEWIQLPYLKSQNGI